ncbi:caspase family protein [Scytonema sp. PCC 10023]|uniref:nSTAND1 domain-containing NTPase n=1 Tax=Scytonema sp. PCC 10023 TaxID=1680591 RepID=UPI0039C6F31C
MPDFSHNLAFVIGINNYKNGISPLQTAINDAKKLVEILQEKHKYQVWVYLDEDATLNNLNHLLEKTLPQEVKSDARLLFYFAGHGIALNSDDGPQGYLIPQDAKAGDINTYLPMTQVHECLTHLNCRHFLGIFDCCFAGAFRWSFTRNVMSPPKVLHRERYDRFICDPAWQVITSAAADQKALDALHLNTQRGRIGNHSPFATALFEALTGAADIYPPATHGKSSGDGVITATELYLYIRDRVEPATEAYRQKQTPGIWSLTKHDKGEYVFLTPGHPLNLPPAPPLDESKNPYRGLQPFDEKHSDLFFGRTELVKKLHNFVATNPLTVVLGASGSGKSSLVKAGLIPLLKSTNQQQSHQQWSILPTIRPGVSPFLALNYALAHANLPEVNRQHTLADIITTWVSHNYNSKLLLFIDQSEELVTLCDDEEERKAFLNEIAKAIITHPQQLRVVLTLRSDFEPQLRDLVLKLLPTTIKLENTALKNNWQKGRFIVSAMTRAELREAIEKPAETRVMYFQPHSLVDQLIDEVADMPGALPLLSFALSELYLKYLKRQWEANNRNITIDRALTQADYEELGGVIQSLTQRAEQEYKALVELNSAYKQTVPHVMLRMVAFGGGEVARRRVSEIELEYPEPENKRVEEVVKHFCDARLLISGADAEDKLYVEPAHDALICGWHRLREWVNAEKNLELQRRLTPAALEWKSVKNNEQLSSFSARAESLLNCIEQKFDFIENWFNKSKIKSIKNTQKHPREKSVNYLWNDDPYLAVLNEKLKSSDYWLNQAEAEFVQRSVRRKQRNTRLRWTIAIAVMLGSGLSVAALTGQRNAQIRQIEADRRVSEGLWVSYRELESLSYGIRTAQNLKHPLLKLFPPNSQVRYGLAKSLQTRIYRIKEHNHLFGHSRDVTSVSFSPDGQMLVSASKRDKTIKLWSVDGRVLQTFTEQPQAVTSVTFSPDGKTIASASEDKTIKLWSINGQVLKTLTGHTQGATSVTFSPDGKTIASASEDKTIKLWSTDGRVLKTLAGHTQGVTSVTFSPDGKTIASSSQDNTIKLWSTNGQVLKTLTGHTQAVTSVTFSPDGKTIASASNDKTIKLWSTDGQEPKTLSEHKRAVLSVSFSPDNKTMASSDQKGVIKLWSLNDYKPQDFPLQDDRIYSVRFSPDGKTLALASGNNSITLWRPEGESLQIISGHDGAITDITCSGDGKIIASASEDNTIKLWNANGQLQRTLTGHSGTVKSLSFSPDSRVLASASEDKTIKLWYLDGRTSKTLRLHGAAVTSVIFSPDGKTLASGSEDNTIKLWNVDGQLLKTLTGHNGKVISLSFSPDRKMLASASADRTIKLWNLETWKAKTLGQHDDVVTSVSFNPDSKTLASASQDATVKLWSLDGQVPKTLRGHRGTTSDVSFSPDGQILASVSRDSYINLWRLDGQELTDRTLHSSPINSVTFSHDGQTFFFGSDDGKITVWNLNLDDLEVRGCRWLEDYLKANPNQNRETRHICENLGAFQ